MSPHPRLDIYRAVNAALGRHMTAAERIDLDRYLDKFGIPRGNSR